MEEFKVVQRKHAWIKRNLQRGFEVDLFLKLLVIFKEVTLKAAFLKAVLQEAIIMALLYSMYCRATIIYSKYGTVFKCVDKVKCRTQIYNIPLAGCKHV